MQCAICGSPAEQVLSVSVKGYQGEAFLGAFCEVECREALKARAERWPQTYVLVHLRAETTCWVCKRTEEAHDETDYGPDGCCRRTDLLTRRDF